MRELSKEETDALGLNRWGHDADAVEIDEVKGATIAGLYMDSDPTNNCLLEIVLVLTDGRAILLSEESEAGWIAAQFGTVKA